MRKYKIDAVHEADLETFFKSLGLLAPINNKKLRCESCNNIITLENFGCIYPNENNIKLCCNKLECYNKILRRRMRID